MHIIAPEVGLLGTVPIVAASLPIAVGAALAINLKGEKKVSVSFFGDGAVNEGVFYETLNFASLKKLPVIFVCENNFYSTHLPMEARQPADKGDDPLKRSYYRVVVLGNFNDATDFIASLSQASKVVTIEDISIAIENERGELVMSLLLCI